MIRDFFKRLFGKQETTSSDTLQPVESALEVHEPVQPQQMLKTKKPRVVKPKAQKEVVIHQTAWPFEEPAVAKPTNKRSKKSTDSGEKSSVPVITATKKSSASKPKAVKAKTAAVVPSSKRARTKKNV